VALAITLDDNAGTVYSLPVTSATLNISRDPLSAPPGGNVDPILIDLGFSQVSWTLSGTVEQATGTSGGNVIVDKQLLEDIVTDWWNKTITFTVLSDAYTSVFSSLRVEVTAKNEDVFDFTLVLLTKTRT